MGAVIEVETLSHPMMSESSMRWEKGPSAGRGGGGRGEQSARRASSRRERSKLGGPREQDATDHSSGKGPAEVPE